MSFKKILAQFQSSEQKRRKSVIHPQERLNSHGLFQSWIVLYFDALSDEQSGCCRVPSAWFTLEPILLKRRDAGAILLI